MRHSLDASACGPFFQLLDNVLRLVRSFDYFRLLDTILLLVPMQLWMKMSFALQYTLFSYCMCGVGLKMPPLETYRTSHVRDKVAAFLSICSALRLKKELANDVRYEERFIVTIGFQQGRDSVEGIAWEWAFVDWSFATWGVAAHPHMRFYCKRIGKPQTKCFVRSRHLFQFFARPAVPWKLSASFVSHCARFHTTKRRKYAFIGRANAQCIEAMDWVYPSTGCQSLARSPPHRAGEHISETYRANRLWIAEFAAGHFDDSSFLRITDAGADYAHLGAFDHSGLHADTFMRHDDAYFQIMGETEFTLCPAGDSPWSYRFFEAIACLSIPVVDNADYTWIDETDRGIDFFYALKDGVHTSYDTQKALHNLEMLHKMLVEVDEGEWSQCYREA